jgi:hypothetical protein
MKSESSISHGTCAANKRNRGFSQQAEKDLPIVRGERSNTYIA